MPVSVNSAELYFSKIKDFDKEQIYQFIHKYYPEQIRAKWWDGINKEEEPKQAALRELLEETGYTSNELEFVAQRYPNCNAEKINYQFIARNCVRVDTPKGDHTEFISVKIVSMKEFIAIVRNGDLSDVGSGYRCLDYLGKL